MPTNIWAETNNPAGSSAASNSDDDTRKIRLDLYERLLLRDIDLFDDPFQFVTPRQAFIHWSAFNWTGEVAPNISINAGQLALGGGGATDINVFAPLTLPRGSVITAISALGILAPATASLKLYARSIDTTAAPSLASSLHATVTLKSIQAEYSAVFTPFTIDADPANYKYYFLELEGVQVTGATRFLGVRIEYYPATFW